MLETILFYALAALAVLSALVVVGQRNPTSSAFALVVTLLSLSGIFGLLGSPFVAVLQIVVYAGAIMVLFLFVLMLLGVRPEEREPENRALRGVALALVVLLCGQVASVVLRTAPRPRGAWTASTTAMAHELFQPRFLYAFEATSVLILAALVGAIVISKRDL